MTNKTEPFWGGCVQNTSKSLRAFVFSLSYHYNSPRFTEVFAAQNTRLHPAAKHSGLVADFEGATTT
jgi:hypothetical protein